MTHAAAPERSSGPTVTDPARMWAVTGLQHPAVRDWRPVCEECLALTDDAITDARITGSVGATRVERGHSVTVSRVHALAVL